jgi:PmbA protein
MQRDGWYHVARQRARLDSPEEIGRAAARRALRRLGARRVKTAEVPVVFDPDMAASLLRHVAAAAAGPPRYRGASFLLNRLGKTIASPAVTIVDDGTLPGALGSRPFDGEGLPVRRTMLVDQGVLATYLLDTYSARKLGLASTHHAARDGSGVTVSTTNLHLAAGTADPRDLIASVKNGLYVTELIGFGVNGVTGDYSRGAVGFWIEDGELAYPVEEITVAGNLLEMWKRVEGVGNDLVFGTARPPDLADRSHGGRGLMGDGSDDHRQPLSPARPAFEDARRGGARHRASRLGCGGGGCDRTRTAARSRRREPMARRCGRHSASIERGT